MDKPKVLIGGRCNGKTSEIADRIVNLLESEGYPVYRSDDLVNHGKAVTEFWIDEFHGPTIEQIEYLKTLKDYNK